LRGSVYFHKKLPLSSGATKDKLLVQVNTPSSNEPYLVALTPSQERNRPKTPGCIYQLSLFYIEANKPLFDRNTWIQLCQLFEFDSAYMIKGGLEKELHEVGVIPKQKMNEIANCYKRIDDVTPYQLRLIDKSREA
jgi:hypothetical protein